uniref:Uncharacterized protein n=1 Tax=Clastoptera arizonana TaxID=38151 RepID=A0A1B6EDL7_9HEMI
MEARVLMLAACFTLAWAQQRDYTTPVPILKQINKHNEDGSYSYGYEGADGSYKIETKHPTGEVYGKYGFVDDAGQLREIEYGASRRGFEPAGTDINVAPPTLNNNYVSADGQDDGQYREDPSIYWKDPKYNGAQSQPAQSQPRQSLPRYNAPKSVPRDPAPQYNQYTAPQYSQPQYNQYSQPQKNQYSQPQNNQYSQPQYNQYSQPQYEQNRRTFGFQDDYNQGYYNPQPQYRPQVSVDPNVFQGHPARNIDISTGSYSVQYK